MRYELMTYESGRAVVFDSKTLGTFEVPAENEDQARGYVKVRNLADGIRRYQEAIEEAARVIFRAG